MAGFHEVNSVRIAGAKSGELSKDSPIFGERPVALAVLENQPMTRVTSVGSFETQKQVLTDLSVATKDSLDDGDKEKLETMKDQLSQLQNELSPDQQSSLTTVIKHIEYALDHEDASQSFMLGLAKKGLEKLEADIQMNPVSASDAGKSERSGEHGLAGLLNKLITFLGSLLASKPTPHVEEEVAVLPSSVVEVPVEPKVSLLKMDDPVFVNRKETIFQKLNKAINELAGLPTDVLYTPETEQAYENKYNELKAELDGLARDSGLDQATKDDNHPLIAGYNKLRSYQEKTTERIEALKAPKKTEKPVGTRTAEEIAADDAFAKAAAQATKQGF